MRTLFNAAIVALAVLAAGAATARDLPRIRAAILEIGTVNWELATIVDRGFDKKHGFELVIQPYADNGATRVALEGDEADIAVIDWIWVARQRAAGKDYQFIPYSRAVGGMVVPADSTVRSLTDLAGRKIGIAGGPLDKSWLILRAYAQQDYGMDLAAETEQVFGAPPLIYKVGLSGDTDASINFWHFLARMKADGMRELVSTSDAATSLGLDPDMPILGYVLKESFVDDNPGITRAFYRASRDAKALLLRDDAAWDAIRPKMRAKSEAQFIALRDDFRAGIPRDKPIDAANADRFLKLMAELGGAQLVGKAATLPDGLFADLQ